MNKQQLKVFAGMVWSQIMGTVIAILIIALGCVIAFLASSGNHLAKMIGMVMLGIIIGGLALLVVGVIFLDFYCWLKRQWKRAGEEVLAKELMENYKKCLEELK